MSWVRIPTGSHTAEILVRKRVSAYFLSSFICGNRLCLDKSCQIKAN